MVHLAYNLLSFVYVNVRFNINICIKCNDIMDAEDSDLKSGAYIIEGLAQDCSNSIANALASLQSCTKPSIYLINTSRVDGIHCSQTRIPRSNVWSLCDSEMAADSAIRNWLSFLMYDLRRFYFVPFLKGRCRKRQMDEIIQFLGKAGK